MSTQRSGERTRASVQATPVLALCAASIWIASAGCATSLQMSKEDLTSGDSLDKARLITTDGLEYSFDHLRVDSDSVYGETVYQIEREDPGSGSISFEERRRVRSFSRERVDHVEINQRDPGKTFLAGAGVAAFALFVRGLSETEAQNSNPGGSYTKPDPRR